MLPVNQAGWDRALRVVLGVVLLALGFSGLLPSLFALAFKIFGWVPLVTGLSGWCPSYAFLRISSKRPYRRHPHHPAEGPPQG